MSIGVDFTRKELKSIVDSALLSAQSADGFTWQRAYEELAMAADRLLAMYSKKEEVGGKNRKIIEWMGGQVDENTIG